MDFFSFLIRYADSDFLIYRDVVEEAGPEYSDAVTWCLHNVPDSGDVEGKEERWREDMYVKVVEPLKYCRDQLVAVQKGLGGHDN